MCHARQPAAVSRRESRSAPAGRAGCRAHAHGAPFFSWQPQTLERSAHGWDTNADAGRVRHTGAEVLPGDVGRGTHRLAQDCLCSALQPSLLAPGVWFRCYIPSPPVAAQELFHTGPTDPKHFREGALGAKPPCVGLNDLLPYISGRGFHALRLPHELLLIN